LHPTCVPAPIFRPDVDALALLIYHVMDPYDDDIGSRRLQRLAGRRRIPARPHPRLLGLAAAVRDERALLPLHN